MEPLPEGWRKERYSLLEAERIVAYWRYGAPHPGTDAQPSREAKRSAREDLKPITSFEEKEAAIVASPGPFLPDDPWLNSGGGWGAEAAHQSQAIRRAVRRVPYITRDDLETLCPGLFRDPSEALRSELDTNEEANVHQRRPESTREPELTINERRNAVLSAVLDKLKQERPELDLFALPKGMKRKLFTRCQKESPDLFVSWQAFLHFWKSDQRKRLCRSVLDR